MERVRAGCQDAPIGLCLYSDRAQTGGAGLIEGARHRLEEVPRCPHLPPDADC